MRVAEGLSEEPFGYEMMSDILWQAARSSSHAPRKLAADTMLGMVAKEFQARINDGSSGYLLGMAKYRVEVMRCGRPAGTDESLGTKDGDEVPERMLFKMYGDTITLPPASESGGKGYEQNQESESEEGSDDDEDVERFVRRRRHAWEDVVRRGIAVPDDRGDVEEHGACGEASSSGEMGDTAAEEDAAEK